MKFAVSVNDAKMVENILHDVDLEFSMAIMKTKCVFVVYPQKNKKTEDLDDILHKELIEEGFLF